LVTLKRTTKLYLRLGQARFGCWNVAPFLDNRLLDLPWVSAGPGAHLLRDVNTLLGRLEQWNQLGDVLAFLLWLQVAGLLWDFRDNSLSLGEAFFGTRDQLAARWAAELLRDLLTLGFRGILLDVLLLRLTDLLGPLGTLLLGGVTLSDILALLLLDSLALNNVIFNVMLVVPGLALGLVNSSALNGALSVTDQGSVAELDLLLRGDLPVVNEAVLDKVLLALLFLLGLKVSGVGGVALLGVTMLALNDIVILSLLNHHHLVDTPLTSSGNGSNVQGNIVTTSLTRCTSIDGIVSMSVLMFVVVVSVAGSTAVLLIEWESSPQVLAPPVGTSS